jgi:hypothetical protein
VPHTPTLVPEVPAVVETVAPRQACIHGGAARANGRRMGLCLNVQAEEQQGLPLHLGPAGPQHDGHGGRRPRPGHGPVPGGDRARWQLARLDTLWSTSAVAERLARQAIASMPQWPPTPTGKTLDLREDHLILAVRIGRPPALQGRLPARPAGIQQSVRLGWQVSPRAGPGRADGEPDPRHWRIASSNCRRTRSRRKVHATSV